MMHRTRYLLAAWLLLLALHQSLQAEVKRSGDFSIWNWYQLKYPISKTMYTNVQYQYRIGNNASQFDKSNFYVTLGRNFSKHINAEILYQFTTSSRTDQHTFYAGATYKKKLRPFTLYYRMSLQEVRKYFTGRPKIDDAYVEFRNRLRVTYPMGSKLDLSLSAEPYLYLKAGQAPSFSRIRNVLMANYSVNRYQSVSVFYLVEPSLGPGPKEDDYVLGLTYQISLPRKWSKMKKIFKAEKRKEIDPNDRRDLFN